MKPKALRQGYILTAVSSREQAGPDKISLAEQERLAREYCQREGIAVRKVFTIPGHSRYDADLPELLEDYRAKGISVYDDLAAVWRGGLNPGDMLVMYHDSRAARSKTVYTWITENWLRSGGEVYRIQGGLINAQGEDFQIAMGAVTATNSVKHLVASRPAGMKARVQRGLAAGSKLPFFHKYTYNEQGIEIQQEIDGFRYYLTVDRERWQPLLNDLYEAFVVQRVPYDHLEEYLRDCGHLQADSNKYTWHFFRNLIQSPPFWGILGYGYRSHKQEYGGKFGLWKIDEAEREHVPPDVTLVYNACEPVYKGEQAALFLNQVRDAFYHSKGKASAWRIHAFTGLLICAGCGRPLNYMHSRISGWRGYYCRYIYDLKNREYRSGTTCTQRKFYNYDRIQDYFHLFLQRLLDGGDMASALNSSHTDTAAQAAQLERSLAKLDGKYTRVVKRLADAPDSAVAGIYQLLETLDGEREAARRQLTQLEAAAASSRQQREVAALALADIAGLKLDLFWEQDESLIHQKLHAVLGNYRLYCLDGEFIRLALKPPR